VTASEIAAKAFDVYLNKSIAAKTLAEIGDAWREYKSCLDSHKIIPTLSGYKFKGFSNESQHHTGFTREAAPLH
jgi:hypothetical protein